MLIEVIGSLFDWVKYVVEDFYCFLWFFYLVKGCGDVNLVSVCVIVCCFGFFVVVNCFGIFF